MKIRNPFKDRWGRWRDDISRKEKNIWTLIFVMLGMISARILNHFGVIDNIIEFIKP